jgi:hypothetical protein
MVPDLRSKFNAAFTPEKYQQYLQDLDSAFPGDIEFRVAETPIFIDREFKQLVLTACEEILDVIVRPDFKQITEKAIPAKYNTPNEGRHCEFISFDFGICEDENGKLIPQLIEMQGFPSLFCYQIYHSQITRDHFEVPSNYDAYLGGYNADSYIHLLKELVLDGNLPEEVILLEIHPDTQKTRIDFRFTWQYLGIETVCLTKLRADGNRLYYEKASGERQFIKRIYNRIIFDDLEKHELPADTINLHANWDISWCTHPHWFFRISKYTLPFINSRYVPATQFLHEVKELPADLENYVLKPLFSFAGQGVHIDITADDIRSIQDPENWILQRKVKYASVIETPDVPAKAEIRLFYFWPKEAARPFAAQNLARLSKGKMIGVRYNADKEWVGGSLVYFEK